MIACRAVGHTLELTSYLGRSIELKERESVKVVARIGAMNAKAAGLIRTIREGRVLSDEVARKSRIRRIINSTKMI